jgi:hypothetical protein
MPMLATLEGMVMPVRLVQPEKAKLPIAVTLAGMDIPVRLVQPEKAELPMLVTLEGMVMPVRPVQSEKAELLMLVTLEGIAYRTPAFFGGYRMIAVSSFVKRTPSIILYAVFVSETDNTSNVLEVKPEIAMIVLGIKTDTPPLI